MDAETREWIVRTTNDYLHETIKFGRRAIGEYGLWLYRLKNDADFKLAGDILFQAARKGRKTGDWDPLPSLRYWHRAFTNEYKAIRDHRARRAARDAFTRGAEHLFADGDDLDAEIRADMYAALFRDRK